MKNYEPAMTFGQDTAAIYDQVQFRGDEDAAVTFLHEMAGSAPLLNSQSERAVSRCRWLHAACALMASIFRQRWSNACAPSPAAMLYR